jgi:hypothetical protein
MNPFYSQFFPTFPPANQPPSILTEQTFTIGASPQNPSFTLVLSRNTQLFTVTNSKEAKPNVVIYRGDPLPGNIIGTAALSSMSSTSELSLRGRPMKMKASQLSGNYTVECPPMGRLKWKVDQLTAKSMELVDESGWTLAKLRPTGKEKVLEILVPCDDFFVELVLLSGMAAKAGTKGQMEIASEIIQGIVGV